MKVGILLITHGNIGAVLLQSATEVLGGENTGLTASTAGAGERLAWRTDRETRAYSASRAC